MIEFRFEIPIKLLVFVDDSLAQLLGFYGEGLGAGGDRFGDMLGDGLALQTPNGSLPIRCRRGWFYEDFDFADGALRGRLRRLTALWLAGAA